MLTFWTHLVLLSVGLQFIYSSAKTLNLSHGSFFVLGGYVASWAFAALGNFGIAVFAAVGIAALAGAAFYIGVSRLARDETSQLFFTFALFWIFEGIYRTVFGVGIYNAYAFAEGLGRAAGIPWAYILGATAAAATLAAVYLLLYKTPWGLYLRAAGDNPQMAEALGVKSGLVHGTGVVLGVALAALGGAVSSMWQSFTPGLAGVALVYAFAVVAMAGLGNVMGALVASLIISLIRTASVFYAPELELFSIYIAVLAVLAVKPSGLFTRHERRV